MAGPYHRQVKTQREPCLEVNAAAVAGKVGYDKPRSANLRVDQIVNLATVLYVYAQAGDGGVDVVVLGEGSGELVQCKSSLTEGAALGPEAIQEVVAGAAMWSARFPGVRFARVAITNRRFGPTARQQADFNEVRLVQETDIADLLARYPLNHSEIERMILAAAGPLPA